MKVLAVIVAVALTCWVRIAAAADTGEPSDFIRQFRSGMAEKGYKCELRQGDLLCAKSSMLVYVSSSYTVVDRAKTQDLDKYCEQIGETEMKSGFVSDKGFKQELVLSASITTGSDLVCVVSYL